VKTFLTVSLLLSIFGFSSCKQLSVSEKESTALNVIANLYGGSCMPKVNLDAVSKYGKTKCFEIQIQNSEFLNENATWTEMYAANIAYLFFTFIRDEKQKYSTIKSFISTNQRKVSCDFPIDTLEMVYNKMTYVNQVVALLQHHNYEKIEALLKPGVLLAEEEKPKFINELKSVDSVFGEIIEFTPAGFRFSYPENGNNFLHISGNLKRTKQDTQFSIDINPTEGKNELYLYGYEY
jgi:hypothetical protein